MIGVNRVIIVGRLGAEPELRYTNSGMPVVNFTVATNRLYKDKDGERNEDTEWHRVVFYGKLAELSNRYLKKGRPVYLEGRLKTRKWEGKDGVWHYTTEIVGENLQFLNGKGDEEGSTVDSKPGDGQNEDLPF